MEKCTKEDTELGFYVHGKPTYRGGVWERYDIWHGNDGVSFRQYVFANSVNDDSNIYRGECEPGCLCCYLRFLHTEEHHKAQVNQ